MGLLFTGVLHAQGARLTAQWSADTVRIGEPVSLRLSVSPAGDEVPHFPELSVPDPAASLVQTHLEPLAVEYVFTFWDVGRIRLPGIPVKLVTSDGAERTIQTDSLSVFVVSSLTGQEQDIREIKSMVPIILTDPRTIWIRVGAMVLLLGAAVLIWRTRQQRVDAPDPKDPRLQPERVAKEGLKALRAEPYEPAKADEHYLVLSRVLRRYLEQRFLFRALEMTTSEIKDMLSAELDDAATATLIGQVLEQSDLAKFADMHHSASQWQQDLDLAEGILDRTRPAFRV